jgi:hypothetical protein
MIIEIAGLDGVGEGGLFFMRERETLYSYERGKSCFVLTGIGGGVVFGGVDLGLALRSFGGVKWFLGCKR